MPIAFNAEVFSVVLSIIISGFEDVEFKKRVLRNRNLARQYFL